MLSAIVGKMGAILYSLVFFPTGEIYIIFLYKENIKEELKNVDNPFWKNLMECLEKYRDSCLPAVTVDSSNRNKKISREFKG